LFVEALTMLKVLVAFKEAASPEAPAPGGVFTEAAGETRCKNMNKR